MKNNIFRSIFALWVMIWALFLIKDIFVKGDLRDYNALLHKSLEGKRAYVTGDRLYEFLIFCNNNLPEGAEYTFVGLKKDSHDKRRVTYYLYPHLEAQDAEFILAYNEQAPAKDSYEIVYRLDETRYIMKKMKKGN